jgi:hypothetical protein
MEFSEIEEIQEFQLNLVNQKIQMNKKLEAEKRMEK